MKQLHHFALTAVGCGLVLLACGTATTTSSLSSHGATAESATATASPTATANPTSTPTPAPAFNSHAHAALAACRIVDPATAKSAVGTSLSKDTALSGFVGAVPGLPHYVQDDCGYDTGGSSGPSVRVVVFEPEASHKGTRDEGATAFDYAKADLVSHGADLATLSGLGDAAVVWTPKGAAEIVVLDYEVVIIVGVFGVDSPLDNGLVAASLAVHGVDTGTADGAPGS